MIVFFLILLTASQKKILMNIAKKSIEYAVVRHEIYNPDTPKDSVLLEKRGCFVTLKKHGMLRGCIGYIFPVKPLYLAVRDMGISAALRDPRFMPVKPEELKELEVEISVLSPLKEIKDTSEIVIGRDGLYLIYDGYSGVLLPQVATEYGWNRLQFLKAVSRKAGLNENAWKKARLFIFSAEVWGEKW